MASMTGIEVQIFEKTAPGVRCPNCDNMRGYFQKWLKNSEDTVVYEFFSAEANRDKLIELGATAAPVYVVKRDGRETIVSGDNPDILLDALEGDDDFWEVDCSL